MLIFFLKGLLVGGLIAIPVGPVGVLCVRRCLTQGKLSGLFSGLGAASADAIYAAVTGFGISYISSALLQYRSWIEFIGGIFLIILGIKTLRAKPDQDVANSNPKRLLSDYFSTFMLTLTSPSTLLAFAAYFAGFGLAGAIDNSHTAFVVVGGVFSGTSLWWIVLSEVLGHLHQRNPQNLLTKINKVSGILLTLFGLSIFSLALMGKTLDF